MYVMYIKFPSILIEAGHTIVGQWCSSYLLLFPLLQEEEKQYHLLSWNIQPILSKYGNALWVCFYSVRYWNLCVLFQPPGISDSSCPINTIILFRIFNCWLLLNTVLRYMFSRNAKFAVRYGQYLTAQCTCWCNEVQIC